MENFFRESGVKWLWERIKTLLSAKQDKLVSGTNIKTVNGTSLLGSGNVSISGGSGGDFNSSGTYPNLTAGKATKLATARKIGLTGGAVGTATNFDGSSAINIPVTKIDEGILAWSNEDSPSTLMDIAYLNGNGNKIAGIPPSLVTIEYSADNGATWRDSGISDASKIRLTNHRINGSAYVCPNGSTTLDINYQTRITIDLIEDSATNAWVGCFEFRKIILKCSGIQRNDTHTMTVEMQKYGSTTWDIIKVSRFWGNPGLFSISTPKRTVGYPSASYYRKVRLTWQTGDVYTKIANINGIFFMSDNTVGVGGGKEPSQYAITGTPYSVDYNQNATFLNAIIATKLITKNGTANQVVLGNGSLRPISELSPITDADAEILLDNHIHSIDVNANGNDVNISVIESSKNGDTWETEDNDIPIPLATTTSAGLMSKEDKTSLDNLINDGYIYPTNYLANWSGDSTIEVDSFLQIELDNITSYNSNTEGLIFTVDIQTPTQHSGGDYIFLALCDNNGDELAYIEHLITDEDCYNGTLHFELKCPLVAITSGYIDLYNSTNEPINIANPTLKRYEVKNVRDISDKLLVKLGDINTILESIINS